MTRECPHCRLVLPNESMLRIHEVSCLRNPAMKCCLSCCWNGPESGCNHPNGPFVDVDIGYVICCSWYEATW